MIPPIRRLLETGIYVADMAVAVGFYTEVLGLQVMLREERLSVLNGGEGTVLLLFLQGGTTEPVTIPGGVIPAHDGSGETHFAFAVDEEALDQWRAHLEKCEVEIESEVSWERGGTSIYFRDPDGHCLELATPGVWPNY